MNSSLFRRDATPRSRRALEAFVEAPEQRAWLDDWALYAALPSIR